MMTRIEGPSVAVRVSDQVELYSMRSATPAQRRPIPASALSDVQRNAVWRHIKATDPMLAALLSEPGVKDLRDEFGAIPVFARDLVDTALAAAGLPPF